MSSCETLFGKARLAPKMSHLTISAAASVAVKIKAEPVVVDGAETTVPNGNNVAAAAQSGGFGAGSTIGLRTDRRRRGDHRAIIDQRVNRSRYPPAKPATPERLEKIKEAAAALDRLKCKKNPSGVFGSTVESDDYDKAFGYRKNGNAGARVKIGAGAGASTAVPESMEIEGKERGSSMPMRRRGGAEWGTGELDEIVLPWYVFGLRREQHGVPQAQWFLDMNMVHL